MSAVHGDLSVSVLGSKDIVKAGTGFSIGVKIINPYEVPITVCSVVADIPDDFESLTRSWYAGQVGQSPVTNMGWFSRQGKWLDDKLRRPKPLPNSRTAATPLVAENEDANAGLSLQAGESRTYMFRFRSMHPLLFTPMAHTFCVEIDFSVGSNGNGEKHSTTAQFTTSLHASTTSMLVGAVLGGIVGGAASLIKNTLGATPVARGPLYTSQPNLAIFLHILLALILSILVVLYFARRSGVQPFVSIEDLYGAILIGILIGYVGPLYVDQLIGITASGVTAPQTFLPAALPSLIFIAALPPLPILPTP